MVVAENGKLKNSTKKKVICLECEQSRHIKKNCQRDVAGLTSGSKLINRDTDNNTNIVSLSIKETVF